MNISIKPLVIALACTSVWIAAGENLRAQNPFEFGAPAATPARAAGSNAAEAPAPRASGDLVLDTIRESKPTTPEDLLRAVQILRNYGAIAEAKGYLKELIDQKPNQDTLVALTEEFGEVLLVQLVVDTRLQPEGQEFARAALKAYTNHVRAPARLNEQILALSSDSSRRRREATAELRKASDAAVDRMVLALADPARASEHAAIRQALVSINPPALEMLLATLSGKKTTLRINAIQVLGRIGDRRAAAYLVEPYLNEAEPAAVQAAAAVSLERLLAAKPTPPAALQFLEEMVHRFELGGLVAAPDAAHNVSHWEWLDSPPGFQRTDLPAPDASLATAADLAGALFRLTPERIEARRRYLLLELQHTKVMGGFAVPIGQSAPELMKQLSLLGPAAIDDALDIALKENNIAAATAAAEILGEIGDVSLLHAASGYPRPLAAALSHGDSRLRFAAATAIARMAPTESYAGAARFAEAAAHFIRTEDIRAAVVCEPRESRTHLVAGLLTQNGIEGIPTYTGKRAWEAAANTPDCELVFLSWAIDRPNLNETLQMFRTDKRTKRMPIAVMTDDAHRLNLEDRAFDDPLTIVVAYPHTAPTLDRNSRELLALLGRHYVPVEERLTHAKTALGWFEAVALHPETQPNHDLLRHSDSIEQALFVPRLAEAAARVLGALATPQAQQALVNFASQAGRPLQQRKAAAEALEQAIDRRGVQLTQQSILEQYDRYNDSRYLPVETQQVLGSVLDAIEKPTRTSAPSSDSAAEVVPAPAVAPSPNPPALDSP